MFNDDVLKLESSIRLNDSKRPRSGVFYPSVSQRVALEKYKSDFRWFFGGLNPLAMAEGADLYFEYEAWYILSFKVTLVLMVLFLQI